MRLAGTILGIFLLGVLSVMLSTAIGAAHRGQRAAATAWAEQSALSRWYTQATADAEGSILFIPTYDIFGASQAPEEALVSGGNGSGHLVVDPNGPATWDEYERDWQHQGHWIEWRFNAATHEVEGWRYSYRDGSGKAVGVASAPFETFSGIAWARVAYLLASQVPQVDPYVYGALQKAGLPICAGDGRSHPYQSAGPAPAQYQTWARATVNLSACYPFDVSIGMGFPDVEGGNRLLVVDVQAMPPSGQAAPPAGTGPSSLHLQWIEHGFFVRQKQTPTVYYTPPPAGALNVSPTYMQWRPDKGQWVDASGINPLPSGNSVSVAESWYAKPWTATQGSCSEAGVGAVSPSQVFGLQGGASNQGSGLWSVAFTPNRSPASPWSSGPFVGSTVGYSNGGFGITANGGLSNAAPINCTLTVASTDSKAVDVAVVIDPESCPAGYTGTPPNCVLPTPTPAPLWVVSYTQTNGTTKVEYSTGNPGPCCGSNGTSSITWTLQASNGQTVPNCTFTASGVDTNPSGNAISSYQASGCPAGYTYAWFTPSPATMVFVSLGNEDSYDTTQLYNVASGLMTPIPNCSYVLEMNWQPWNPLKYRTLNSAQITAPNYGGCPASYNTFPGYY